MVSASSNTFLLSIIDSIKLLVKVKQQTLHIVLWKLWNTKFCVFEKELKTSIVWENSKFNREKLWKTMKKYFFSFLSINTKDSLIISQV